MGDVNVVLTNLHFRMQASSAPIRVNWYYHFRDQMPPHAHEFTELVVVLQGNALHRAVDAEGRCYERELARGDILLLRVGEQHFFDVPEGERLLVCNILYESRILSELFCRDNPDSRALQIINEYADRPATLRLGYTLRADDATVKRMMRAALRIRDEVNSGRSGSAAFRILALGEILTEIGRLTAETYPAELERREPEAFSLRPALNYIHQHYCENVTMDELAALSNCTPRHLSRRFKQATGETVGEYVRRLRIAKACYLLQHTQLRGNRVANAVGYQEYAGFVRVFNEQMGMTPTKYRRSMVDGGDERNFPNRFYEG